MFHTVALADNWVFLDCKGEFSVPAMVLAWKDAQAAMVQKHEKRLLMDFTKLKTAPQTEELFDLAKLLWRGFPQLGWIAMVVRWDQSSFAKLLEMLVRGVGMYLTVFVSEERAEAWLLAKATGEK